MAKQTKAYFSQRLVAFIIDMLFVTVVASLLAGPFIDSEKIQKYEKQETEIMEKYTKQEISPEDYLASYESVYYKLTRDTGVLSIITILLEVIYFVVYQLFNGGQTIGKKIMKIKVISENGDLDMNQMIYRSLLSNFILVNILTFMFLLFTSRNVYFVASLLLQGIQYIIILVSVIMILSKNTGCALHDKLAHTKVIQAK